MSHLFVSYSHKDKEYVHKLADAVQADGFEVWIDDRIDFGTRWPLVIESAIDSCDSFILVASENSHASEWVQHELARAQRLHKQVFPLLLNGHPWISFESTQYFNVTDQSLPNQKFYAALKNSDNRRFTYFREMVSGSWPVYCNKEYQFSVNYPRNGDFLESESEVQVDMPVLKDTNLLNRALIIHFKKDGILSSSLPNNFAWIDEPRYIDILGLRFLKERGSEGGMSKLYECTSYSTLRQNKVVTLSLNLITRVPGVFTPGEVTIVDSTAQREILLNIVSSFTWLE